MEIQFFWNGSFAGVNHSMIVNGKEIRLGGIISNPEEAKNDAIKILKNEYNVDFKEDDINFTWGGAL